MLQFLAQSDSGGAAAGGLMFVLFLVIGLAGLALWIWALIDAIRNPSLDGTMRIVWILVIVVTGFIGAIIYLLIGRSRGGPAVS